MDIFNVVVIDTREMLDVLNVCRDRLLVYSLELSWICGYTTCTYNMLNRPLKESTFLKFSIKIIVTKVPDDYVKKIKVLSK